MLDLSTFDVCWSRSGVSGDCSCPGLKEHIHCRNCPAYAKASRRLLDAEAPEGYIQERTEILAQAKEELAAGMESAVIFRIRDEWLALPVKLFKEITTVRSIRRLPHRTNEMLLGMVNIRGELQLCVSLSGILGIRTTAGESACESRPRQRMAVMERRREQWVFPLDEISGLYRFNPGDLRQAPVTIAKAAVKFTKGILSWQQKSVGLLDDELLFYALKRKIG